MAVTHGRLADIYLNGYDFTGVLNKVTSSFKQDIQPVPVFGKSARPKIYGVEDGMVKLEGWLDEPTGLPAQLALAVDASQSTSHLVHAPDGDVFGNYAWVAQGFGAELEHGSEDSPNKLSGGFETINGLERVAVHQTLAALTADTLGTNIDAGAASTVECIAFLAVHAFSGFSQIVVKVQHSPDNSAWSDLVTFTTVTGARTCERKVVASGTTVQRHTRATVTKTGTGSAEVFVGFGRKQ